MKQSVMFHAKELFPGSDITRKYTFRTESVWDNCVHFAKINHQLTARSEVLQDSYAHLRLLIKDCFGCRSPYKVTA